jgi:hypothetical protein
MEDCVKIGTFIRSAELLQALVLFSLDPANFAITATNPEEVDDDSKQ